MYSIDPATGTETVLHSFTKDEGGLPEGDLTLVGDKLYGTTSPIGHYGTVFSFNLRTGTLKVVHAFDGADGAAPNGSLIDVDGVLYGTTNGGGSSGTSGRGAVFSLNLATEVEAVAYAFQGGVDGAEPDAGLTAVNGSLYGTTQYAGAADAGTIFEITP